MNRICCLTFGFLAIGVLAGAAWGQMPGSGPAESSAAALRFQVATIKPSGPEEPRTTQIQGIRFATTGTSVVDLLKYAYGLQEQQIAGGPKWLSTQKFDVVGDPETPARPSSDEFKKMVQNLLTDRFHLAAHRETRDLLVFEIVVAKGGAKLNKSRFPPEGIPTVGYAPGQLSVGNATMADFAAFLQRFVADRPVMDGTGIAGKYDLSLRWTPDEMGAEAGENKGASPGLFTVLQEQLGLKLEEAKRPAPVLVIDRIEMPTEN